MISFFENLFGWVGDTLGQLVNGLVVGILSFADGVLEKITHIESLIEHAVSSVTNLFEAFLSIGHMLLPMLPAEWSALIETTLIVLAVGMLIRKKVIG